MNKRILLTGLKLPCLGSKFVELTDNNIFICASIETASQVRKEILAMLKSDDKGYELSFDNIDSKFINMTDKEFESFYKEHTKFNEWLDKITLYVDDYIPQDFYITCTPEVVYNAKTPEDIWFITNKCDALTYFREYKDIYDDKEKLVEYIKFGRLFSEDKE